MEKRQIILSFNNKKGNQDTAMGMEEWIHLILIIGLLLILLALVPLLKKILK